MTNLRLIVLLQVSHSALLFLTDWILTGFPIARKNIYVLKYDNGIGSFQDVTLGVDVVTGIQRQNVSEAL